jgi:hypothetical protein
MLGELAFSHHYTAAGSLIDVTQCSQCLTSTYLPAGSIEKHIVIFLLIME